MRLVDLEPKFLRSITDTSMQNVGFTEAEGVRFLCPKCFEALAGPIGCHSLVVWNPKARPGMVPVPRWTFHGASAEDLTLLAAVGDHHSIELKTGCMAHFFLRHGEIVPT